VVEVGRCLEGKARGKEVLGVVVSLVKEEKGKEKDLLLEEAVERRLESLGKRLGKEKEEEVRVGGGEQDLEKAKSVLLVRGLLA